MGRLSRSRKLVVDDVEYRWRFTPGFELVDEKWMEYICVDKFCAFTPTIRHAAIRRIIRRNDA